MNSRRPKARRIPTAASSSEDETPSGKPTTIVKKPARKPRPSTASSTPKLSFGGDSSAADDETSEPVFVPKKSALSRKAIERNAARKAGLTRGVEQLQLTPGAQRISYSKEYLEELKRGQSTEGPTPEEAAADGAVVVVDEDIDMMPAPPPPVDDEDTTMEDASGMELERSRPEKEIMVPDEGMVRIMKQRRKERAEAISKGGKDFISLNEAASDEEDDDDDDNRIVLRPKKKKESRLTRGDLMDDEDDAAFVDPDDKIMFSNSRKERREAEKRRKQGIKDAIEIAAEDDSDASGDSLREEWEREQVRKGAFSNAEHAQKGFEAELEAMAKNPPVVMALPKIGDVVKRLEATLKAMEIRKAQTERQVEMLVAEKSEIREREEMVQKKLDEVGKMFGAEAGFSSNPDPVVSDRGLESFGNTPIRMSDS